MLRAGRQPTGFWFACEQREDGALLPADGEKEGIGLLPKRERITREREIKQILNRRSFHFSSSLLYFVADDNNKPYSRLAVVCSRRLGMAVRRNRVRRVIFGVFSRIRPNIGRNVDIVIVPRTAKVSARLCEDEIIKGFRFLGLC